MIKEILKLSNVESLELCGSLMHMFLFLSWAMKAPMSVLVNELAHAPVCLSALHKPKKSVTYVTIALLTPLWNTHVPQILISTYECRLSWSNKFRKCSTLQACFSECQYLLTWLRLWKGRLSVKNPRLVCLMKSVSSLFNR